MTKYKNLDTFVRAMRKDKQKKLWRDWFSIGGHCFTCEEYDGSGKYMRFTSITKGTHIDLETANRYGDQWLSDLVATEYEAEEYRFDWRYYMEEKELASFTGDQLDQVLKNIAKANL